MDRALELKAEMIALESMTPSQLLTALPKRLPEFFSDVKNFVTGITGSLSPVASLIDTRKLDKTTKKFNYVSMTQVTVYVPAGMNVQYSKYLEALEQGQDVADRIMDDTLKPMLKWLAIMLTSPSAMANVRGLPSGVVLHDLKKAKESVNACYSKHGSDTQMSFGDVFRRNADLTESAVRLNHINERLAKIDRKDMIETVNEIVGAMDKLLIRMQQNPDEYKMSGVTMKSMTELSMNLGYEIEFFAAHSYMVQAATQAMNDTSTKLESIVSTAA